MLHLIHPALVHFSVAFLFVGAPVQAWGLFRHVDAVERFGGRLVLLGTLSLVPTIVSGYIAANTVTLSESGHTLLDLHEGNALALLSLFAGLHFWKGWCGGRLGPRAQRVYGAVLVLGAVLTASVALLGGKLTYVHGAGTLPR